MSILFQDLRYGVRTLVKNRGFTSVAVVTLALGIGAVTAIFSVVEAVLLRPLPYQDSNRLVYVSEFWPHELPVKIVPSPDFQNWREHADTFEDLAGYGGGAEVNLTGRGEPERIQGVAVTGNFLRLLGVQPVLGRGFLPEEDRPDGTRTVLLSHALWQRRFGSNQHVVGSNVNLDSERYTIVGVMPSGFRFPATKFKPDLFLPMRLPANPNWHEARSFRLLRVIARVKPGISLGKVKSELNTLVRRTASEEPIQFVNMRAGMEVRVVSLHDHLVGDVRPLLLILSGVVGLVLTIACINVANLELARATARQKEMALRAALGGRRTRLVLQLLIESALLAILGGVSSLLVAFWGLRLLQAVGSHQIPGFQRPSLNAFVLVFALLASCTAGLLSGLAPALVGSSTNLIQALKEGGVRTRSDHHHKLRRLLVLTELSLATILLTGSGLLIRSFLRLVSIDPGFDPHHLLTIQIPLPQAKYSQPTQQSEFFTELLRRTHALPGVQSAALTSGLPPGETGQLNGVAVEGRPFPAPGAAPDVPVATVSEGYLRLMGIRLIRGREFEESDRPGTPLVAIVNQTFARQFFPGQEPISKHVKTGARTGPWREIIGIAEDIRQAGLNRDSSPEIYIPYRQSPAGEMFLVIRTAFNPPSLAGAIKRDVQAIDPNQPMVDVSTMDERLAQSIGPERFNMVLLTVFAAVALCLGGTGLYGVMSYTTSQRTHEIGIRIALGAARRNIMTSVLGQAATLTVVGISMGLLGAIALTRFLTSLLFGVRPTDPVTFVSVAGVLIAVSLLASYIPARRATKVDPIVALRYE